MKSASALAVMFWVAVVSGSLIWKKAPESASSGLVPSGRQQFAFGYDETSNQIILFGGHGDNNELLTDTWILNVATFTWKKIEFNLAETSSYPPKGNIVTYGVCDRKFFVVVANAFYSSGNTVWSFDLDGNEWKSLSFFNFRSYLRARSGNVGGISSKHRLIVSHGSFFENSQRDESYALTLTSQFLAAEDDASTSYWGEVDLDSIKLWKDITPDQGDLPPKRSFAAGTMVGDTLVMSGGYNVELECMDDTWKLDVEKQSATWIKGNSETTPGKLESASMVQFSDDKVIQFGGATIPGSTFASSGQRAGEYAILDLNTLEWTRESPRENSENPSLRSGQGLVRVKNKTSEFFVLFGGKALNPSNASWPLLNDIWVLEQNEEIDPSTDKHDDGDHDDHQHDDDDHHNDEDSASSGTQGAFMGVIIAVMASATASVWM